MKIDRNDHNAMEAALLRIPLRMVFNACNKKYFFGKLPSNIKVRWVKGNEPGLKQSGMGMPEGAHWSKPTREIRLRTSALALHPDSYQFFRVMVHEMTHAYLDLCLGNEQLPNRNDYVLLKSGKKKPCHHGELFGRESRRIAQINGNPVSGLDCCFGSAGKKWAREQDPAHYESRRKHNVLRAESRRKQREKELKYAAFRKLWYDWASEVYDELNENTDQYEEWDAKTQYSEYDVFRPGGYAYTRGHLFYADWWDHYFSVLNKESLRQQKAAAFKARLNAIPIPQQIATLQKRLANPKTPKQFIAGIHEKIEQLRQQGAEQ